MSNKAFNFKGARDAEHHPYGSTGIENTGAYMYEISLDCGDKVYTPILLRQQYQDDKHFILCPNCKDVKLADTYARQIPTAWQPVVSMREINENELTMLRHVLGESPFIVSRDILRVQPSVPSNRARPFPYVAVRRNVRFS